MSAISPIAVATAVLAMALAGCTGGFQVDQTEPFRIQLEGAPETVTVRETDAEPRRVEIETCREADAGSCDVEQVEVKVAATAVSSGPCKILVTIQDEDGNTLETRVIDVNVNVGTGDGDDGDGNTTGNTTTTETTTRTVTTTAAASSGNTVIQNIVVNVKGAKNIVVLTQAQQGAADVDISAIKASGNADVGVDDDEGSTTTASASMTASGTATSSSTSTTGP